MLKIATVALLMTGCGLLVSEDDAVQAAQNAGLTRVVVTDTHVFFAGFAGCAKDDAAGFDVSGVNPNGQRVEVTVCCGAVFKGCTVRY